MGIDIYSRWSGQTEKEKDEQITGFSTYAGKFGYLREAYHGEPYGTMMLVAEAFDSGDGEATISASVLRSRLPEVLILVGQRQRMIYKATEEEVAEAQQSFVDFVELCERKEKETGEPVTITASY